MKLVKLTDDHYVVVDDSEIKEGDWMIRNGEQPTLVTPNFWWDFGVPYKKITHSTQPFEHGTEPFADGVQYVKIYDKIKPLSLQEVQELIGEVDVEKKAREIVINNNPFGSENFSVSTFNGLVKDITKALEDNKEKKYTEEQLIWAIQEAYGHGQDDEFDGVNKIEESIKAITKHIQAKTEWEVEWETIDNRQPCDCSCHNNPNMIHFVACCNDGWIGTVIQKLKLK